MVDFIHQGIRRLLTTVRLFSVELVQNLAVLVAVCAISGVVGRHLRDPMVRVQGLFRKRYSS